MVFYKFYILNFLISKNKKPRETRGIFFYLKIFTLLFYIKFNLNYERKQNLIIIIINEKKKKARIFFDIINCVLLIRQLYSEIKMVIMFIANYIFIV